MHITEVPYTVYVRVVHNTLYSIPLYKIWCGTLTASLTILVVHTWQQLLKHYSIPNTRLAQNLYAILFLLTV